MFYKRRNEKEEVQFHFKFNLKEKRKKQKCCFCGGGFGTAKKKLIFTLLLKFVNYTEIIVYKIKTTCM